VRRAKQAMLKKREKFFKRKKDKGGKLKPGTLLPRSNRMGLSEKKK